jgi:flagellar hook protein FlgE
MPNFAIALSGLEADNTELNTIANNLSNMSTTAYKAEKTNFSDMFYESLGSSGSDNPIVVGTGTKVASTTTDTTQGDYDTTGTTTSDMAIDGEGYFVVADTSGSEYLTRNGEFTEDTSGHLETSSGNALMGYEATDGTISSSTLSELTLPTKGSVMSASASTEFRVTANLNSSATEGTSFTSTVELYDSLGESHEATITYTKTSTANEWNYTVTMPNSDFANVLSGDESGTTTLASGTMAFDSSGNLAGIDDGSGVLSTVGVPTTEYPDLVDTVSIDVEDGYSGHGLADGATLGNISWNLLNASGGQILTQTSSASSNTSAIPDGYTAGTYESFTVDTDGTIAASYSNGETVTVGQVALATVANEQGLTAEGSSLYKVSSSSGTASVGTAGSGALGTIKDSALEDSNVDISTEFSQLIIAQRAFQANSKSITTFDSVTETAIGMIRS